MKKLRVTVDGKVYEVLVEILDKGEESPAEKRRSAWASPGTAAPAPVASAHVAAPPTAKPVQHHAPAAAGEVPSPLAGKVVSVDVQAGQKVEANDQLITLEAMKMNTYVFAPAAGTIEAILVKPGDAVEEGQALVKLA
ncbi:MAG: acetyl-CoA carboxylase biotin carboxyl carrier protein subunit [Chthoniobacterales bacterium]|nr:acetyl-CoA carboxylase biotin carboxyl carrier protein subunit [Chthoniobacterales bacterium]